MSHRPIFPELVTGRDDQFENSRWEVRAGWALRGHASCDFVQRVLEVPLGTTTTDRVIRAHELMHLRISPHDVNPFAVHPEIVPRAFECAEEFRVNELLRRLGFDVAALIDGSEMASALRLAHNGAWDEAVYFFAAIYGTGGEKEFLKGVRKAAPSWLKPLTILRRRLGALVAPLTNDEVGSTDRPLDADSAQLPHGFERVSVTVARLLVSAAQSLVPETSEQLRQFRRSLEPGGRRAPTGQFATLIFDHCLTYDAVRSDLLARRSRPQVSGSAMRYPSRLLTDPQRRAFTRPQPARGGVVIVDQSGSMDLDPEELDHLLTATPGALVVGYSHRPGDQAGRANAWLIAREGQRARELPTGNVGNGVDGAVLRWAVRHRRRGDRVLWVTDGQVTDSNDHPSQALSRECALLVLAHRVRLVRTLGGAAQDFRSRGGAACEPLEQFGRIGREIREIRFVTGLR